MKNLYLILPLLLLCNIGMSQYYYTPYLGANQNPGALNKDNEYPPGGGLPTGWTTIMTGPQVSGAWSSVRTLPFRFLFNGSLVTSYKVSSSGVLTFNTKTTMVVDSNNLALPSAVIPDSSIAVWGLRCLANDYVVTKTFGTAPNRQHWICYNSFSEENLKAGWIYISIVLEETTNKIYIVDQRTNCVFNNAVCTDKTKLTLGIQVDQNNAIQVKGSPDWQSDNKNNFLPDDNSYYEFILGVQPDDDVIGLNHDLRKYYETKQFPLPFSSTFKNIGKDPITKLSLSFNVNDGTVFTSDIDNLNIASLSNFTLQHPDLLAIPSQGTYTVKSWLSRINDATPSAVTDDTIRSTIIVNDSSIVRRLLHENFSSSTCPPCKPGNETLHGVLNQYPDLWSELTYHFYFPGTGDPYYTTECAARSTYYGGISAIPATLLDGKTNVNPNGYNNATFESYQTIPAFHRISPSGTVTGQKIDVKVDVDALIATTATTRLQVALAEKVTYKNVKTNGETEFPHVMKKLIPDANGTLTGIIPAGGSKTFNLSWTAPGAYRLPLDAQTANIINLATEHSIEEFDDLEVVVWLQESDKSVLQSNSADLSFIVSNDNPISLKSVKASPSLAKDYFYLDLSAFDNSEALRILVADANGEIIHSQKTQMSSLFVNTSNWIPGVYFIKVIGKGEEGLQKIMVIN